MASSSDRAIAPLENAEEYSQNDTQAETPRSKRRCEIEDRIDYKTVRHARRLAAKRGEQPMAWNVFKKKLDR
jgi:hypothetical protein